MKKWIVLWVGVLVFSSAISWAAENPKVFKLGYLSCFSGVTAAVTETQKKGILLAVDQANERGGLNMPWGKVKIDISIKDDELKLDVGVRRFRELVAEGMNGLTGTLWNPMAAALNEECKLTPMPYFPGCIPALDSFKKGNQAACTFTVAFSPWSIGYASGVSMSKMLGKKRIFHLSRSDVWGTTVREGLAAALKEHGGEVIGLAESPQGTLEFTSVLNKAKSLKPDVLFNDFFAGDAIASIKQAHEIGLNKTAVIFNAWTTNVVGLGIPENALAGLYALQYFYYDVGDKHVGKDVAMKIKEYTDAHIKKWGEPPDNLGTVGYIATQILLQSVEKAGSFDPQKISKVVMEAKEYQTVKGPVRFREDHQAVDQNALFLLKGKSAKEKKGKWDLFKVENVFGGESLLPPLKSLGY
jgi:ABC-type branched-subunit amino acid transport system substrate-binding protein